MSRRRINVLEGTFWGGLAVLLGVVLTFSTNPPEISGTVAPQWVRSSWYFLGANHLPVEFQIASGDIERRTFDNIIEVTGQMRGLYGLPPILMTLATVLTGVSASDSQDPLDVVQDCFGAAFGYVGAVVVVIYASGGQPLPGVRSILLGGFLAGGLLIGARFSRRLDPRDATIANFLGLLTFVIGVSIIIRIASLATVLIVFGGVFAGALLLVLARLLRRASPPGLAALAESPN